MTVDPDALLAGNRRALAKAITLVESRLTRHRSEAQQLLARLVPHTGRSIRIGVTGVPGAGKSTFIESLGCLLVKSGHKVAVLAVDPSSPVTGGSILGDKTRMETLSQSPAAFIRPSPASGALGGVAGKTRESMLLCEAAGHDVVLIETVGVGQSEYEVASMVDFFLVLMIPNAGDELQGIKKGILELADAIVVNKADGPWEMSAQVAARHYENALHLVTSGGPWRPRVLTCSAQEHTGIQSVWDMVLEHARVMRESGLLQQRRQAQNTRWMWSLVDEILRQKLDEDPTAKPLAASLERDVAEGRTTPYLAATAIVATLIP